MIEICVEVFRVRKGRLLGSRRIVLEPQEKSDDESLADRVLLRLYEDQLSEVIPALVYIDALPSNVESFENLLGTQRTEKVKLHIPQKGSKKRLMDLALENVKGSLERRSKTRINDLEQRTQALADLHQQLNLKRIPLRIE